MHVPSSSSRVIFEENAAPFMVGAAAMRSASMVDCRQYLQHQLENDEAVGRERQGVMKLFSR